MNDETMRRDFSPKFGDKFINKVAGDSNPRKIGMFVRVIHRAHGRMNPGKWWQMTDGKGDFWESNPDNLVPVNNTRAQASEPEGVESLLTMAYRAGFIQACQWPDPVSNDVDSPAFAIELRHFLEKHTPLFARSNAKSGEVEIPKGWALVPIEPTEEMLEQAATHDLKPRNANTDQWNRDTWSFMLDGSPDYNYTHDKTKA